MARFFYKMLGLLVLACGLFIMAGWLFDHDWLIAFNPNSIVMVFNTGLCFTLCAFATVLPESWPRFTAVTRSIVGCAVIVFSTLIFSQNFTGVDLHLDELFTKATIADYTPSPGRMALPTSVCFIFCGMSLLTLAICRRGTNGIFLQFFTVLTLIASVISISSATVRLELLYEWYQYGRMAMFTALCFFMLASALWLAWYDREIKVGGYLEREDRRISVSGILIIVTIALAAGLCGFGLIANQLEKTLEAGLEAVYNNHARLVQNSIELAIARARPLTTRLLLNRSLLQFNQNPGNPEARKAIEDDVASFSGADFSAIAIYAKDGTLVTQTGTFAQQPEIAMHLTLPASDGQVTLLWKGGALLDTTMDIVMNGDIIGSAAAERPLPSISALLLATDPLGDTAETRLCHALTDNSMECLPSHLRSEPFLDTPRYVDRDITSMDFALRGKTGSRVARDYLHHQVLTVYGPVADFGLGLVVKINTDEFYGPLRKKLEYVLLMLMFLSVFGILLQRVQLMPLVNRLVRSEARIKAVMENVADGIITVTGSGMIESVNPAVFTTFGYTKDQVIGQNLSLLMPSLTPDIFAQMTDLEHVNVIVGRNGIELPARHADGHEFTVLLTVSEMNLEGQRLFVGSLRDITDRKRLEKLKSEFVSTVSHELRTPLTSIRGSLGLLVAGTAGALSAQAKDLIGIAHKNCERLILLINDILDVEKIESGQLRFTMEWLDLKPLLEQAVELNKPYGEKLKVGIVMKPGTPHVTVHVDNDRFLQVMSNLLSNALKFSPAGQMVEISAQQDGAHVHISITDCGNGIPQEFQPRIFQKFAQADSSDTRAKGGTGLGLNIAKSMIEHMGGTIAFTSREKVGTTFTIQLPAIDPAAASIIKTDPCRAGNKILVCEDDPDISLLLKTTLEQHGYSIDVAHTAAQAAQRLNMENYTAMTLDLMLPDKPGLVLLNELRAQERTARLPVIIVSARSTEGKKTLNGQAIGIIDWLPKPIDMNRLLSAVSYAGKAGARPAILHVEDDADIARVINLKLQDIADIIHAPTLAAARNVLQNHDIDVLLLDVMLPDGSGLGLLEDLNKNGRKPIPTILFCADDVSNDISRKVAAVLIKSKTSEEEIVSTIVSLIRHS